MESTASPGHTGIPGAGGIDTWTGHCPGPCERPAGKSLTTPAFPRDHEGHCPTSLPSALMKPEDLEKGKEHSDSSSQTESKRDASINKNVYDKVETLFRG